VTRRRAGRGCEPPPRAPGSCPSRAGARSRRVVPSLTSRPRPPVHLDRRHLPALLDQRVERVHRARRWGRTGGRSRRSRWSGLRAAICASGISRRRGRPGRSCAPPARRRAGAGASLPAGEDRRQLAQEHAPARGVERRIALGPQDRRARHTRPARYRSPRRWEPAPAVRCFHRAPPPRESRELRDRGTSPRRRGRGPRGAVRSGAPSPAAGRVISAGDLPFDYWRTWSPAPGAAGLRPGNHDPTCAGRLRARVAGAGS